MLLQKEMMKEKKAKPGVLCREGLHLTRDVNDVQSQKTKPYRNLTAVRIILLLLISFQEDEEGNSDRRVPKLTG